MAKRSRAEYARKWRSRNKDRYLATARRHREKNRAVVRENLKRWRKRHPGHWRKTLYGLSQEAYETLLQAQNDLCVGCGEPLGPDTPCVDHDHNTGRVRGIVHQRCNKALGFAEDRPERLERLAQYLRRN